MENADVTLTPAADGTYAIATVGRDERITLRLRRAGIGNMLGWDPKTERDAVEARIREHAGADLTFAWTR